VLELAGLLDESRELDCFTKRAGRLIILIILSAWFAFLHRVVDQFDFNVTVQGIFPKSLERGRVFIKLPDW
jgi:hypothetical protein